MEKQILSIFITTLLIILMGSSSVNSLEMANLNTQNDILMIVLDSPAYPPCGTDNTIVNVESLPMDSTVILYNVPSSTWTYGCGPTAAGMLFGYYDRSGFPNMYTGHSNGGVCPMQGLGQGSKDQSLNTGYPVEGSCYIIATEIGLDGITSNAHVNDFYVKMGEKGDSYLADKHTWDLCIADFIGASQWKWDLDLDGTMDRNADGSVTVWVNSEGEKLYDFYLDPNYGPPTSFCHGLRLFAQSRGYAVLTNFNQLTDNCHEDGFTFLEYKAEIDSGCPVLIGLANHAMIGIGYDESTTPETIYLYDTWDYNIHHMKWGGSYCGYPMVCATVLRLMGGTNPPEVQITQPNSGAILSGSVNIEGAASDSDGSINRVEVKIDNGDWKAAIGTDNWSFFWDTTNVEDGQYTVYAQSIDDKEGYSPEQSVTVTVNNNHPPENPSYSYDKFRKELTVSATDIDEDKIRFGVSFSNDGSIDQWTDYVDSGTEQIIDCDELKNTIGIIVEDEHGAQSDWVSASPKNKEITMVLLRFIEKSQSLFSFLQRIRVI